MEKDYGFSAKKRGSYFILFLIFCEATKSYIHLLWQHVTPSYGACHPHKPFKVVPPFDGFLCEKKSLPYKSETK